MSESCRLNTCKPRSRALLDGVVQRSALLLQGTGRRAMIMIGPAARILTSSSLSLVVTNKAMAARSNRSLLESLLERVEVGHQ